MRNSKANPMRRVRTSQLACSRRFYSRITFTLARYGAELHPMTEYGVVCHESDATKARRSLLT